METVWGERLLAAVAGNRRPELGVQLPGLVEASPLQALAQQWGQAGVPLVDLFCWYGSVEADSEGKLLLHL